MTTIVWDGTTLAWDSQLTIGDIKSTGRKDRRLSDGSTVVVCGGYAALDQFVEDLDATGDPSEAIRRLDSDSMLVHLRTDGSCWVYTDESVWRVREACAWGSGKMSAFTCLAQGMDAKSAATMATKVDLYSSLPIRAARARRQRTPR